VAVSTSEAAHLPYSSPNSGSPARPTITARCVLCADAIPRPAAKATSRAAISPAILGKPHRLAISPLAAHQQQDQPEHNRHVPEVPFLGRGHAASRVAHVLGQRRRIGRLVEPSTGLVGNP